MSLIDWEYSGMSDYASDFGTFAVCCQLSEEEASRALAYYFRREPSAAERRHNFAYVALRRMVLVRVVAAQGGRGRRGGRVALRLLPLCRTVLLWYEQGMRGAGTGLRCQAHGRKAERARGGCEMGAFGKSQVRSHERLCSGVSTRSSSGIAIVDVALSSALLEAIRVCRDRERRRCMTSSARSWLVALHGRAWVVSGDTWAALAHPQRQGGRARRACWAGPVGMTGYVIAINNIGAGVHGHHLGVLSWPWAPSSPSSFLKERMDA